MIHLKDIVLPPLLLLVPFLLELGVFIPPGVFGVLTGLFLELGLCLLFVPLMFDKGENNELSGPSLLGNPLFLL